MAIFFDIANAYGTAWKHKILEILKKWGFRGNLMYFINNFLSERQFSVQIGNITSENYKLENATSQGEILSVTLFLVIIDSFR